jgi:sulfite exporter TauE/SafE
LTSRRKAWFWSVVVWLVLSTSALYPVVDRALTGLTVGTLLVGLVYAALRWALGDISLWWAGTRPFRRQARRPSD